MLAPVRWVTDRLTRITRLASPLCLVVAAPLAAQTPVRGYLMGDPLPGRDAPAFSLPYATVDGPGPSDQPFVLRAELGRVVVLALTGRGVGDPSVKAVLRTFVAQFDSLFAGDVVVAVVTPDTPATQVSAAHELGLRFKLLADTDGAVRRLFGVGERDLGIYVVGIDNRIIWRDLRFNPNGTRGYAEIRKAVVQGLVGR